MRFQFSLASLLAIVVGVGFLLAGLTNPTTLLGSAAQTTALALLLYALLGAALRSAQERNFWIGFAIFGWAYFILVFSDPFKLEVGNQLITTRVLLWAGGGNLYASGGSGSNL